MKQRRKRRFILQTTFSNDYPTNVNQTISFVFQSVSALKHSSLKKIFPSIDVNRIRRLSETFSFLKSFDTEKTIAEINILYSLYMKHQGNLQQICQLLQIDTIDKVKFHHSSSSIFVQ